MQMILSLPRKRQEPELVGRTIEHYKGQYFNKAEMVIHLLEHLVGEMKLKVFFRSS